MDTLIKRASLEHDLCCVCLEKIMGNFVVLYCCNNKIHKKCLLDWIVFKNNEILNCVFCRTPQDNFNKTISLGELIDFIENSRENIIKTQFVKIINKLYKNTLLDEITNEHQNLAVENNSRNTKFYQELCLIVTRIWIFILFIFFVFMIIMLIKGITPSSGK
jgi:hypothetical protein